MNKSKQKIIKTNAKKRKTMKFFNKLFAKSKNMCTFVMLYAKQHSYILQVQAIFYALKSAYQWAGKIKGYQIPLFYGLPCLQCSCCLATTGGDSLSYINLFKNLIHS